MPLFTFPFSFHGFANERIRVSSLADETEYQTFELARTQKCCDLARKFDARSVSRDLLAVRYHITNHLFLFLSLSLSMRLVLYLLDFTCEYTFPESEIQNSGELPRRITAFCVPPVNLLKIATSTRNYLFFRRSPRSFARIRISLTKSFRSKRRKMSH